MITEKPRFSSATLRGGIVKIDFMRIRVASLALALGFVSAGVCANSQPLDFSYRVTGPGEIRPMLVFNDGVDTFIQPQDPADKTVLVNGTAPVRQGPYYVIYGLAGEITMSQQGGKAITRIAHTRKPVVKATPAALEEPASVPAIEPAPASIVEAKTPKPPPVAAAEPRRVEADKPRPCRPERRESAFVASFKAGTSTLSDVAKAEVRKFIGDTSSIERVEVTAEGAEKIAASKRADTIRSILVGAGVESTRILTSVRTPTGIGTEIHIHRAIDVCGASVVRIPSRRDNVTVIWDRDAKELAERIAAELSMKVTVVGDARPLHVRVTALDVPFAEAMSRIGQAMDDGADLILRSNELVLRFKEKK